MKSSIASLEERFKGWLDWDIAMYQLGACLGFWPEFGAPYDEDQWHGVKWVMWSHNATGDALHLFLDSLVLAGHLEKRNEPDLAYRWNPDYKE